MDLNSTVQTLAGLATAIGVGIAAYQLRQGSEQRRATFEQCLIARYEEIQSRIDLKYLIDGAPYDPADEALRRAMYDYFELCEEERYYVDAGRATRGTWEDEWWPGIKTNFTRAAFTEAWLEISPKASNQFMSIRPEIDGLIARTRLP
jgi:hypothetical protein